MSTENQAAAETDGNDTAAVLAAAEGDKTYLPEKATAEPDGTLEEPATEDPGDDAAAAPVEAEAEKPKPKQTAQERIDELTRARREAERDVEYWKAKATQPQQQPAPEAQDTPQGDGKPNRADYGDDIDSYIEDLTDWKANEAAARLAWEAAQRDQARSTVETFQTRLKALFPDGATAGLQAFNGIKELPTAVLEIIGASDVGPKLAEHLGDNPQALDRLWTLNPVQQARELTLIEASLSTPARPAPKTATDAPEPPPQSRGAGGQFKVAADTGDFAAFEKQYRIGG